MPHLPVVHVNKASFATAFATLHKELCHLLYNRMFLVTIKCIILITAFCELDITTDIHLWSYISGYKGERRLMTDVFDSLDRRVRPSEHFTQPVYVAVELHPLHFKGLVSSYPYKID